MCATVLTAVTTIAKRHRETCLRLKARLPNALAPSGIDAAWRQYIKDNPDFAHYRDEFVRVARGEE
jgi:hypothetical protein